ncbi:MAG: enoyl-CoA hydratase/isomerase family protein [Spirochaetia bacterium]|nr:enoyl-CoA hydratase/isomerase family protein [Spirochaetia bacterium]
MQKFIEEEIHPDGVIEIRMNFNPENTFSFENLCEMNDIFLRLAESSNVRVIVLSSASEDYFTAGLDPSLFLGESKKRIREVVEMIFESSSRIFFFPQPVIAAVNGHCMGAGAVIASYCDYRFLADRKLRFGFPEAAIGMNVPSFSVKILTDILGLPSVTDMLYKSKAFKPNEALEAGLVDALVPPENLRKEIFTHAAKLAKLPRESSRGIKEALRKHYKAVYEDVYQFDLENTINTILSENTQEGFLSIKEKRRPRFK